MDNQQEDTATSRLLWTLGVPTVVDAVALTEDAARYRWLRAHARTTGLLDPEGRAAWYLPGQTWAIRADTFEEAVDRVIAQDAARAQHPEKESP